LSVASFNSDIATYVSYFILISGSLAFGIPHGALDHILIRGKRIPLLPFILKYLIIIGLYFALWHYFPLLSLISFIIFSSFHFGESELEETGVEISSIGSCIKAFMLGACILLFIICTHFEESLNVIANTNAFQLQNFNYNIISIYSIWIASISLLYIVFQIIISKRYSYLGIVFLLIIGVKVPLIFAFGLYFIFQHSYNAWGHLQIGLNLHPVALYKKAIPYTLGALLIFTAIVVFDSNTLLNIDGFLANVFIFLACISLPHFLLMHMFYKTKNS
jgi:Brp/Blh family beta-carotene 15,15'-monooxygenase